MWINTGLSGHFVMNPYRVTKEAWLQQQLGFFVPAKSEFTPAQARHKKRPRTAQQFQASCLGTPPHAGDHSVIPVTFSGQFFSQFLNTQSNSLFVL